MGLVVDLGLERFGHEDDGESRILAMLQHLVEGGYTKSIREVFVDRELPAPKRWAKARIVEVTKAGPKWLAVADAAPIRKALATLMADTTYDSYAWDELDGVGAFDVQDLALPLDGKTKLYSFARKIDFGNGLKLGVIDLKASIKNWPTYSFAYKLHKFAIAHRMIVHSA